MVKQLGEHMSIKDWEDAIRRVIELRLKIYHQLQEVAAYYRELGAFLFHEVEAVRIDDDIVKDQISSLLEAASEAEEECWGFLVKKIKNEKKGVKHGKEIDNEPKIGAA